jgi:hypothetical protein
VLDCGCVLRKGGPLSINTKKPIKRARFMGFLAFILRGPLFEKLKKEIVILLILRKSEGLKLE